MGTEHSENTENKFILLIKSVISGLKIIFEQMPKAGKLKGGCKNEFINDRCTKENL